MSWACLSTSSLLPDRSTIVPRPSLCSESARPGGCWPTRATTASRSSTTSRLWERSPSYPPRATASNSAATTKPSIGNANASNAASRVSSTSAASPHATKNSKPTSKHSSLSLARGYTYSYMSILPSGQKANTDARVCVPIGVPSTNSLRAASELPRETSIIARKDKGT